MQVQCFQMRRQLRLGGDFDRIGIRSADGFYFHGGLAEHKVMRCAKRSLPALDSGLDADMLPIDALLKEVKFREQSLNFLRGQSITVCLA